MVTAAPLTALARPLPAKAPASAPAKRVQSGEAAHAMVAAANPLAVAAACAC